MTVTGTMVGGPADTVIQRNGSSVNNLLVANSGVTNVTVSYLTFDGNRYGVSGINCWAGDQSYYTDVLLTVGGTFNVQYDDFINSPGQALLVNGGTTVSYSNFGQGGYGVGPGGGSPGTETAAQTASRWASAVFAGSGDGAWYNAVAFAGTAGISLHGAGEYAYGNLLQENRYELSDGEQGGQLYVDGDASSAQVAASVINGNYWPYQYYHEGASLATGCSMPASEQYNDGTETYGTGHAFYNNEIEQSSGNGMIFGGVSDSPPNGFTDMAVSSANPWDSSDTPRFVENNVQNGIQFLGPPTFYQGVGVLLNDVLVQNNGNAGVNFQKVQNDASNGFTGFENGSCMSGNSGGNVTYTTASTNPLANQTPSSYSLYQGGSCPSSTSGSQSPPSSNSAFFATAQYIGSGWYYMVFPDSNLFGYYAFTSGGSYSPTAAIYHDDLGYESIEPGSASGTAYLYDYASGHWWYTSLSLFPDLYDYTLGAWIYYVPPPWEGEPSNPGHYTSSPRWFENLTTGVYFTM